MFYSPIVRFKIAISEMDKNKKVVNKISCSNCDHRSYYTCYHPDIRNSSKSMGKSIYNEDLSKYPSWCPINKKAKE